MCLCWKFYFLSQACICLSTGPAFDVGNMVYTDMGHLEMLPNFFIIFSLLSFLCFHEVVEGKEIKSWILMFLKLWLLLLPVWWLSMWQYFVMLEPVVYFLMMIKCFSLSQIFVNSFVHIFSSFKESWYMMCLKVT